MAEYDLSWDRIGRNAAYLAGGALLVSTLLFLADATDLVASSPQFHKTAAGPLQDIANYYAAFFNYQHRILWDVGLRDTLAPIAFVALIVVGLAVRNLVGRDRAQAQLMTLFFLVGGVFAALDGLTYLAETNYWRYAGWRPMPAADMVAVGRASEAINNLTMYFQLFGFLLLSLALLYLGRLCREHEVLPTRLGVLAYTESAVVVGLIIASVVRADTAYNILALLTGVLLGPAVAIWLGWHFGRLDKAGRSASSSGRRPSPPNLAS